ncbi:hypothetical protein ACIG87_30090 [Micromonospora sp. NPDC051925]|uniref:hypothetical protein n=1 Tax=Micromonospora sp. NPDC051925 TaxID=3364288 RepID=UPI0037C62D09
MDEGSEETAVPPGRRGERRAGEPSRDSRPAGRRGERRAGEPSRDSRPAGRHGFGPVEPTPTMPAGPGAPPDPAPPRRSFPTDTATGDLPDNSLEETTGMHPEGISRE